VLRRARPVRIVQESVMIQADPDWLNVGSVVRVEVSFWPDWRGHGEPDVLLTLYDGAGNCVAVVLVEAKLHAPKSGQASEEDDELADDDLPDPDQLVRYWQGLKNRVQNAVHARMIYLTKHGAPPANELGASVRRAPGMELAWLSWRDVWAVAEKLAGVSLPAADLACLLEHKGLKHFNGFHAIPWQAPPVSRFWSPTDWFAQCTCWGAPTGSTKFWKE
jgi:hypothetical protein